MLCFYNSQGYTCLIEYHSCFSVFKMNTTYISTGVALPLIRKGIKLITCENMKLHEPANIFLHHHCSLNGKQKTVQTYNTYANHLIDFLNFLEDNGIDDWRSVTTAQLYAYRNRMCNAVSPITGKPYDKKTITARVCLVGYFYEWAFNQKLILSNPIPYKYKSNSYENGAMSKNNYAVFGKPVNNLILSKDDGEIVSFYSASDINKIMGYIKASGSDTANRDRTIIRTISSTGFRRLEVLGLTVHQMRSIKVTEENEVGFIKFKMTITKGGIKRDVFIPRKILDEILNYIENDRAKAIVTGELRAKSLGIEFEKHDQVFVYSASSCHAGRPFGLTYLSQRIGNIVEKSGCKRKGPHAFRHTFAVNTYKALFRNGISEPWKILQILLGHRSIKTTMDIYLKTLTMDEVDIARIVESYQNIHLDL